MFSFLSGFSDLLRTATSSSPETQHLLGQISQKIAALPRTQTLPPRIPPSAFLAALVDLDTANFDHLQDFLTDTHGYSTENSPQPIPLGTHDGVQYFIQVSDQRLHERFYLPPAKADEIFYGVSTYEAKSIPGGQIITTDLKYGFGLGRLYHRLPKAVHMEDTGFYVICNAVDKSIWIAFDFEPYDETGTINSIHPELGCAYGDIPLDTEKWEIGIMKLYGKEWTTKRPLSLDGGDPFRNGVGTPIPCMLFADPVFIADVHNAIDAERAKTVLGGSSRVS